MSQLVLVAKYLDKATADIHAAMLAAAGIRAHVSADDMGGMRPYLVIGTGVRLLVESSELDEARRILDEAEIKSRDKYFKAKPSDPARRIMRAAITGIFLPPVALLSIWYFLVYYSDLKGHKLRGFAGVVLAGLILAGYSWFFTQLM